MVNYEVKMTFSNPLYAGVTRYFFDSLVVNINDAFVEGCNQKYENQLENAKESSIRHNRSVRDYLNDESFDELDNRISGKLGLKAHKLRDINKKNRSGSDSEFQWTADPRQNNNREVRSKSPYEAEFSSKKDEMVRRRNDHSKNLIRDLFKDNVLSRLDRDKVNLKMQQDEFLQDIYVLDQALGGAPGYKKKIAKHIKSKID